jgi:hypothetical protein
MMHEHDPLLVAFAVRFSELDLNGAVALKRELDLIFHRRFDALVAIAVASVSPTTGGAPVLPEGERDAA